MLLVKTHKDTLLLSEMVTGAVTKKLHCISFISEIMYLDVFDNKPEQPEGRLVVFMPMNEAAMQCNCNSVQYCSVVGVLYSPAMLSDAWPGAW